LTLTGAATPVSVYGNSTHAVNATYSGDSVYPRSTSNAVMLNSTTVPDFTIASATPSQTIAPGQTANYTISLTPQNAFTGTVALSCSGLPLGYTCGFAPASPTLNATQATSTMTISPTQSASIPPLSNGEINLASLSSLRPLRHSAAWLLSSMTLFLLVITRIASARRHLGRIACVIAFSSVCLLQGCGNAPFAPPLSTTYSVIVTGTSGTLKHSTTVTLIVTAAE
jgi:hypothetical protein